LSNTYFQFKQFRVEQDKAAMKVTTDGCLFGAWAAKLITTYSPNATSIADIGTGTGLLSLMLAQQNTAAIHAIEIEPAAAQQANINFQQSPWSERLKVTTADIKTLPVTGYDIIISNPPFYENDLRSGAGNKNLAHHDAGLLLHELVVLIKQQLNPGGLFFLLLPYKREAAVLQQVQTTQLAVAHITNVKQSDTHSFFRTMLMGSHSGSNPPFTQDVISIRDSENNYTPSFTTLLAPYYLYL
jgi:tRNA1Val (adenine37-N6)-methyltransferase